MNAQIVLGQCINRRRDGLTGFDAFAAHRERGLFALCDGANSCPNSGLAAQWLSQALIDDALCIDNAITLDAKVRKLHFEMHQRFPETASTALWVQIETQGMSLGSVGDSCLHVYRRSWAGWGPWRQICTMPRDLDEQGHPRQLIGSEVLDTVHHRTLMPQGPMLALMMSDGPANTLPEGTLQNVLHTLKRQQPSPHDLDYLCQQLVDSTLDLGCQDDASVAMVWAQWP